MSGLPDQLIVEVNFEGVGTSVMIFDDPDRGFDEGIFAGALSWVDVTSYVRSASLMRGTTRRENGPYFRADAGTAVVVLDNQDARFDPTNLSSPYVSAGVTQIRPMRAWRIRASHNGVGYDLWRGFADAWDLDYPLAGNDATVTLTGTDGTRVLTNFNPPATAGAVETTGARITRILDLAEWPAGDRDLDTGQTTVYAASIAQGAWTEVLLAADTEIGEIYVSAGGKLTFRQRDALFTETRSTTVQATFADGTSLPFRELDLAYDDTTIANAVRITRSGGGGVEQSVEDPASQLLYLVRTFVRSDLLMQDDAGALAYASYALAQLKDGELRFDSILILPPIDPDTLYPVVLARELGDRIRVSWTPPGRPGDPIVRDCFVRGIQHEADAHGFWQTRFYLADAAQTDLVAVVGSAIVGTSIVAL